MERILITGANGFIGENLKKTLSANDSYTIDVLQREEYSNPLNKIEQSDIVIHLAGAPIAKRWTRKHKQSILNSRIQTTKSLVDAIKKAKNKPRLFISSSAIGIYSPFGKHDESSQVLDNNFLGETCKAWEEEANKIDTGTRVVIFRLGIVLGEDGGALPKMTKPFKLGLGGKIANGKQILSWIHIKDLLNGYQFVIDNKNSKGIYNLTSPEAVSNKYFTQILAQILKKAALFTIPKFVLQLIYGEASVMLTSGQNAYPQKLINEGFKFQYPNLGVALENILA